MVWTCFALNWDQEQNDFREEVHRSFTKVIANDLLHDFIRIDLIKSTISYIEKRNDMGSSDWSDNGLNSTSINLLYSKSKIHTCTQDQEIIGMGTMLNQNKEC